MSGDSVLVACPTYSGLADSLDEYLAAYAALGWADRRLILVDNTRDGGEYARSINDRVAAVGGMVRHVDPSDDWDDTFVRCWRIIASHAEANGYDWIWSLEQDVIVPPITLDTLLNIAGYCAAPFVTHTYPYHFGKPGYYQGLGCTLMKTDLVLAALDISFQRIPFVEAAMYDVAKRNSHVSLHELLAIEHRDGKLRHNQFGAADFLSASIDAKPNALVIES